MTLDTAILVFWLIPVAGMAAILLALCARGLAEERRAHREGRPLRPGVKFGTDWAGSLGILGTILALCLTAWLASRQEGLWKVVPLLLVNLILQPVCLLLIVGGIFQLRHALCGRITYAFHVLAPGDVSAEQYRSRLIERIVGGVLLVLLFGSLSYACIRALV
jgi:hypothetical protein